MLISVDLSRIPKQLFLIAIKNPFPCASDIKMKYEQRPASLPFYSTSSNIEIIELLQNVKVILGRSPEAIHSALHFCTERTLYEYVGV